MSQTQLLLYNLITSPLNIESIRGRWNEGGVCYSSEPGSACHCHPPWKIDVYTEHMDGLSRHDNNVQIHLGILDVINCNDMLSKHEIKAGKLHCTAHYLCPPRTKLRISSSLPMVIVSFSLQVSSVDLQMSYKLGNQKHISCMLDLKAYTAADTHIEIFSGIHWTPALNLTLTFLSCIRWKIWLWNAITVGSPPAGMGEQYSKVKRRGVPAMEASSNFPLLSLLGCVPLLSSCFFYRVFLHPVLGDNSLLPPLTDQMRPLRGSCIQEKQNSFRSLAPLFHFLLFFMNM